MVIIVDLIRATAKLFPNLPTELRIAHLKDTPEAFVKKALNGAFFIGIGITVFFFFMFSVAGINLILLLPILLISSFVSFFVVIKSPLTTIKKRQRDLDKEVLFAGRFLLVKLYSGKPLLNCLIEASKGYGVAGKYFKEIVDEINMGSSIEQALENAMKYTPSEKFKKILFQINNSLKIGVDVTQSLDRKLDEIAKDQLNEIKRYSKKLNTLSLFYMVVAIVIPSLGAAIITVIGSLVGLLSDQSSASALFYGIWILLFIIQFIFITVFKSSRKAVNI
ncbi:MAG: type II secretion system F family protein [Candidatus Nanoarchaeia archaeon]